MLCSSLAMLTNLFLLTNQVEDLPDQGKNLGVVDELEIQYYETQLELYDVKLEILRNEETILVTRLDSVKRLIAGNVTVLLEEGEPRV